MRPGIRPRTQAARPSCWPHSQAVRPGCRPCSQVERPGCWPFTEAAHIDCRLTRSRPRTPHADPAHRQCTACRPRAQQAGHTPRLRAQQADHMPRPRAQQAGHRPRPRAQQVGHAPRLPTQHAGHAHRQCIQHTGSRPRVHGPTAGHGIAWGLLGRWWAENTDGLLGLRTWGAEPHMDPSPCSKYQTT